LEKNFPDAKEAKLLPFVKLTGAVNTVRRDPVDYINTDASGFAKSLKEDLKFDKKDKNILLIGCGGAGRAVVAGLIWKQGNHPKKIFIYEPNNEAKESAEAHFQQFDISREKMKFILKKEEIPATIKQCQLLVNASPIGMKGEGVSVIDKDLLHDGLSVYDVVYNREKETRLIRDAKEKNLPSQDGLGMLFHQGVLAFEFWRGRRAPEKEMREALMREVKR